MPRVDLLFQDDTIYVKIDVDRCETLPVSLKTRDEKDKKEIMAEIRGKTPAVRVLQVRPVTAASVSAEQQV